MTVARIPALARAGGACGFSLIEVLVALALFAVVCLGALTVMGATASGGLLDASPTALATSRRAKDLTVAAVYLQALHDYMSAQDDRRWDTVFAGWPSGVQEQTYCVGPGRAPCPGGEPLVPAILGSYPLPPAAPYQLAWTMVRILVQRWHWDCTAARYTAYPTAMTADLLVRLRSTLRWRLRGEDRSLTSRDGGLDRFLPYGSPVLAPADEVCP